MAVSEKSPCKSEAERQEGCIGRTCRQSHLPLTPAGKIDATAELGRGGSGNVTSLLKEPFGYFTYLLYAVQCRSMLLQKTVLLQIIDTHKLTEGMLESHKDALLQGKILLSCHGQKGKSSLIEISMSGSAP